MKQAYNPNKQSEVDQQYKINSENDENGEQRQFTLKTIDLNKPITDEQLKSIYIDP